MKLLTAEIKRKLIKNNEQEDQLKLKPVVKFFNPVGNGTWYLTSMDKDGIGFGLCDLGFPELGYVSIPELQDVEVGFGLGIERDLLFKADKPLRDMY